jgi:hypothetical protein
MFTFKIYTENYGLYLPLGHNFTPGDKIRLTSNDRYGLSNGFYEVVFVDGDKIFIDTPPKKSTYIQLSLINQLSIDRTSIRNAITSTIALPDDYLKTVQLSKSNIDEVRILKDNIIYDNDTFQNIRGLDVKIKDAPKITKEKRPKIQQIIKSQYYVSKVIEKELLEYYVKVLEVVDVIEELDTCAFSVNSYDNSNINFFLNRDTNIDNLYNYLNEPISDLYIGIIKNSPTTSFNLLTNLPPFSPVESHFSRFINYVGDNDGIEKITDNAVSNKIKIGDFFYHSVCEHSTENLQEVEVDMLHHRFIHNNIIFTYKPFYKIKRIDCNDYSIHTKCPTQDENCEVCKNFAYHDWYEQNNAKKIPILGNFDDSKAEYNRTWVQTCNLGIGIVLLSIGIYYQQSN